MFQLPMMIAAAYTSANSGAASSDAEEKRAAHDRFSDIEPDIDVDEKYAAQVSRVIKHKRPLNAQSRAMTTEQRDYERRRSSTALQRYCLLQLTRALPHNHEISADRLTSYPWCVRYFQAKYIR